jgi:hypothetical protein
MNARGGVLKIYGFSGDGATYWRKRKFRRGENMALDHARDLVERLLVDRAKLTEAEAAAFEREKPACHRQGQTARCGRRLAVSAFKATLAEWFGRTGFSSADAASVLGWLAGRSELDYFTGAPWSARDTTR